jgi:hypothetical protein
VNLYYVQRHDPVDWDEMEDGVVCANDAEEARLHVKSWARVGRREAYDMATVSLIGTAAPDVEAGLITGDCRYG